MDRALGSDLPCRPCLLCGRCVGGAGAGGSARRNAGTHGPRASRQPDRRTGRARCSCGFLGHRARHRISSVDRPERLLSLGRTRQCLGLAGGVIRRFGAWNRGGPEFGPYGARHAGASSCPTGRHTRRRASGRGHCHGGCWTRTASHGGSRGPVGGAVKPAAWWACGRAQDGRDRVRCRRRGDGSPLSGRCLRANSGASSCGPAAGPLGVCHRRVGSPRRAWSLTGGASQAIRTLPMSNRALWNVRKRHEWLATPLKAKRVKRAQRMRCGLQDAIDRKSGSEPTPQS